jgi:hypothetical protein
MRSGADPDHNRFSFAVVSFQDLEEVAGEVTDRL